MKSSLAVAGGALSLGTLIMMSLGAAAPSTAGESPLFEVTITNLTRNQPFSPILVASHNSDTRLFDLGQPAGSELAQLAEDGNNIPLSDLLLSSRSVGDVASGLAPIGPSNSETILISAGPKARLLSLAGMLVNTNDAFLGLDSIELPRHGTTRVLVPAFDAGSETNNEMCDYIPGPACNNPFVRDTSNAEGYVHVHAGIHGIGDLPAETYDWRNPVALVTVKRVR